MPPLGLMLWTGRCKHLLNRARKLGLVGDCCLVQFAPAQGGTAEGSGAADIPLHTNASENDLRAYVIKRKISGGTMSTKGRQARDVLLGLMKTCRKLGISFFTFLGDRLGLNTGNQTIPPLAELVVAQA
jgi:hypothetical protein